jgi:hypothetical protein
MNAEQLEAIRENIEGDHSNPTIMALYDLYMEKRVLWILTEQDPDMGVDMGAISHACWRVDEALEKLAGLILEVTS